MNLLVSRVCLTMNSGSSGQSVCSNIIASMPTRDHRARRSLVFGPQLDQAHTYPNLGAQAKRDGTTRGVA